MLDNLLIADRPFLLLLLLVIYPFACSETRRFHGLLL